MKQKLLLILNIVCLLTTSAKSQSFMFYRGDQPLEDNAEFTVSDYEVYFATEDATVLSLESYLHLKNVTDKNVQATVTQTVLESPLNSEKGYLSFCFYDCFTGNVNRTMSGVLSANSINPGYHANFYVYEGTYNRIKVKYEVYLTGDIGKTDKKTVTVTYVYDKNSQTQVIKPNINPVFNVFREGNRMIFNYSIDSNACRLEIYNLSGQKIAQHALMSGTRTFVLPEKLTKGIYICLLKDEKKTVATQKIIVK